MTRDEALTILSHFGLINRYYGPGYRSWHAVQDYMARHPRGRGLRPGCRKIYEACLIYQQERSRTRAWKPRDPLASEQPLTNP